MTTLTWQEEGKDPEVFVISDALLASLETYRVSVGFRQQQPTGEWVIIPRDASVRDMFIRVVRENLLDMVLAQFPTPEMAQAEQEVQAAKQALEEAKAAALLSVVVPVGPVDGGKEEK